MSGNHPSICCPVCKMVSYNPNDIREGYCGNCHDWTTPRSKGEHVATEPGSANREEKE